MLVDNITPLRILIIMNTKPNLNTLDVNDLSGILKIKPRSLHARLVRHPESLPTPLSRGHGRKLLWLEGDVEVWLKKEGVEQ